MLQRVPKQYTCQVGGRTAPQITSGSGAPQATLGHQPAFHGPQTHRLQTCSNPQDMFQHNAWAVRVAGMAAAGERVKQVDFSAFYKKLYGSEAQ